MVLFHLASVKASILIGTKFTPPVPEIPPGPIFIQIFSVNLDLLHTTSEEAYYRGGYKTQFEFI